MLTDAPITAIVPTVDLARAKEFYEGTLGLQASGALTPGPDAGDFQAAWFRDPDGNILCLHS